jgi:orotidine 5'-phosphate decarboxylase subfamily 2
LIRSLLRAALSKKDAGTAVDAVLGTIEKALSSGDEVSFTGFGKFHVAQRGASRGAQPAHRRVDDDRREQGPALHGGLWPQEGRQVDVGSETQGGAGITPAPPEVAPVPRIEAFGARLAAAVEARQSQVVVGIDPDPDRLWPAAASRADEARALMRVPAGDPRFETAAAVLAHALALIDAAAPACVAAKPQHAFFEQLGFAGWLALEHVCAHARAAGLLVIADAKRGDVPSTAAAYSRALTGPAPPGLAADAITANPLMGRDALEPLLAGARERGGGAFVLVRTSNPGAATCSTSSSRAAGRCGSGSRR